jgi:hypothetical protein
MIYFPQIAYPLSLVTDIAEYQTVDETQFPTKSELEVASHRMTKVTMEIGIAQNDGFVCPW